MATKNSKWKDVLIRALKTLWQASLSYIFLNIQVIVDAIQTDLEIGGFETIKQVAMTVGMGALAAGLSALYNGVIAPALKPVYVEDDYDEDEMGVIPALEAAEEDDIAAEVIEDDVLDDDTDLTDTDGDGEATDLADDSESE